MDTLSKFNTPIIIFALTLIFGFWLSKLGKPYNGILFNIHKLIALGTVVITSTQIYKIFVNSDPQPLIVILIIITGVCVIALFASGALLSIGNLNYQVMKLTHNIALILAVIAMGATMYILSVLE